MILTVINWTVLYLIVGFIFICAMLRVYKDYDPDGLADPSPAIIILLWPVILFIYIMAELLPKLLGNFGKFAYELARKVVGK